MNILVTGGLGFVGINLVRTLAVETGAQIVIGDRHPWDAAIERFLAPVKAQLIYQTLDVGDPSALTDLVNQHQISHIIHAAAITTVAEQERNQATALVGVNLVGSIHLLNVALFAASVERVLIVSSSGVYGAPHPRRKQPQREDDPLKLDNLYAITKHSAELLAMRYGQLSGKAMAAVRLPAVYGPMERVLPSRTNMSAVGRLMTALERQRSAPGNQPVVTLFGAQVARDWTYAPEIGHAIAGLLKAPRWRYPIYNVSCGVAISLAEVVEVFVEQGLAVTWVEDAAQAEIAMLPQQARAPLAIGRLQGETGFRPRYDLRAAIDHWLRGEMGEKK